MIIVTNPQIFLLEMIRNVCVTLISSLLAHVLYSHAHPSTCAPFFFLFSFQSIRLSIHLWPSRDTKAGNRFVSAVYREMCRVGMAIGERLTQTNIIHPGQYPKMANYTDQLAG